MEGKLTHTEGEREREREGSIHMNLSTSSCSSVNESFWTLHVSAWVRRNSATAFVTVDFTGDGSPTNRASKVTCSGSQLKESDYYNLLLFNQTLPINKQVQFQTLYRLKQKMAKLNPAAKTAILKEVSLNLLTLYMFFRVWG